MHKSTHAHRHTLTTMLCSFGCERHECLKIDLLVYLCKKNVSNSVYELYATQAHALCVVLRVFLAKRRSFVTIERGSVFEMSLTRAKDVLQVWRRISV